MAKSRKKSRKAAPASGAKKKGARKAVKRARAASSKELDLRPLKKQIKLHIDKLSKRAAVDSRVQDALASLQRVQTELSNACQPTMVMPLA